MTTLEKIQKRLAELKELEAKASKDWNITYKGDAEKAIAAEIMTKTEFSRSRIYIDNREDFSDPLPNALFIVASRTAIPQLIAGFEKALKYATQYAYEYPSFGNEIIKEIADALCGEE